MRRRRLAGDSGGPDHVANVYGGSLFDEDVGEVEVAGEFAIGMFNRNEVARTVATESKADAVGFDLRHHAVASGVDGRPGIHTEVDCRGRVVCAAQVSWCRVSARAPHVE